MPQKPEPATEETMLKVLDAIVELHKCVNYKLEVLNHLIARTNPRLSGAETEATKDTTPGSNV